MLKLNKHIYGVGGRYTQTKACQKCKCNRKNVLPPEIKFVLLPNILSVKLLMHGFHKRCIYIYILFVVQNLIQTHPSSHRPLRFHTTSGWAPPNSVFLTWYGKWGDMYMYIYINANVLYIHKCITYTYMQMYYISIFKYVDVLPYQQQNSRQIIK